MAKKEKPVIQNDWETDNDVAMEKEEVPVTPQGKGGSTMMSPIVQPIAFVPFTTQEQAIWQYSSTGAYDMPQAKRDIQKGYAEPANAADVDFEDEEETKKKVRFVPIFLAILSLLIVAIMVVAKYAIPEYLAILDGKSGLDYVLDLVNSITGGNLEIAKLIVPGSIAIVALFSILNFITCLCTMMKKGACVFSKICLFFMLTFSLVIVLIALMDELTMGYGLYGVAGLSFISLLIGYLAANK